MSTPDPNAAPPVATPPSARTITPEEYDALQAKFDELNTQAAQQQALLTRLSPYAEDIQWMVEEGGAIDAVRNTRKALKAMRESSQPQFTDPSQQALFEKVSHLDEFVTGLQKREQDEAERPQREQAQRYEAWKNDPANDRFFKKLVAEHPEIQGPQIRYLAELAAADNFAPLETVWNKVGHHITGAPAPAPPPSSLRADAGEAGATPPTGTVADMKPGDAQKAMRAFIVQDLKKQRGVPA